jgi:hypothetical protein
MGDLFHETVPFSWIDRIIDQAALYDHKHIFVILTKRPEIMKKYFEELSLNTGYKPLSNIWIGVTAENQEQANKRIPILLQIPAAKHFVSIEPMLGPIDLECFPETGCPNNFISDLDWVICGGESGHKARPMHPDWVRSLRDQCKAADVPFFFKQWGEWQASWGAGNHLVNINTGETVKANHNDIRAWKIGGWEPVLRVGRKYTGNLLDGQQYHEWPNQKCKISSPGCVYHACMDDGCQAQHMLKSGYHGSGDCKSIKPIS